MTNSFIGVVGAQRSGTTYLYHILDEHPDIEMCKPLKPEPKFFINEVEFAKGKEYYLNLYFRDIDLNTKLIGEKGTSYLENEIAAVRINEFFPDAKILIILRDPVYRAISNYFFSLNNGIETRTLEEVFIQEKAAPELHTKVSVPPFNYVERSNYYKYLNPYLKLYKDRIKILVFEELIGNRNAVQNLFRFLEVDDQFIPKSMDVRANASDRTMDVNPEVKIKLQKLLSPSIKELELVLNRKFPTWHDSI